MWRILSYCYSVGRNRGTGGESGARGVDAKPSRAWDHQRVLSTPELAHSLPAPGRGGTEAVSGEETRRAQQEVSAPAWPARMAVGARRGGGRGGRVAIPAQRRSVLQASRSGLEGRAEQGRGPVARAQWQQDPGTVSVSHWRLASSQSGCPSPEGVLH